MPDTQTPRRNYCTCRGLLASLLAITLFHATLPRAQAEERGLETTADRPLVNPALLAGLSASTGHQRPIADPPEVSAKKRKAAGLAVGLLGLGLVGLGGYMIATGYWVEEGQVTPGSCRTQYVRPVGGFPGGPQMTCTPSQIVKWPESHTARATAGIAVTTVGAGLSLVGFGRMRR